MMDPLHIAFLAEAIGFPYGMASSTRLRLLARSLVDYGADTSVLIMRGTESTENISDNSDAKGCYHGVNFEYMTGTTARPNNFFRRQILKVWGYWQTFHQLIELRNKNSLDVLVFYTRNLTTIKWFSRLCRHIGVPTVLELCEWPTAQVEIRGGNREYAERFCNEVFDYVDGVIPISDYIEARVQEYDRKKKRTTPTLRVPILVDALAWNGSERPIDPPYLLYSGSLNYAKILDVIIDTSAELKKHGHLLKFLLLGGKSAKKDMDRIERAIAEKELNNIIEIVGYVNDEELRSLYKGATLLLAPFPDDVQTISRFPTKIGEYLASGRPVVTTAFGEASKYLQDSATALIADQCSPEKLADKIEYALINSEKAKAIGDHGRDVALSQFDYSIHGPRLYEFLQAIVRSSHE